MERLNPINMSLEPIDPLKERSIIFCRQVGNITDIQARLTISLLGTDTPKNVTQFFQAIPRKKITQPSSICLWVSRRIYLVLRRSLFFRWQNSRKAFVRESSSAFKRQRDVVCLFFMPP